MASSGSAMRGSRMPRRRRRGRDRPRSRRDRRRSRAAGPRRSCGPGPARRRARQRLITACMTCSIIRMVTPPSRMARMTGTMSRTSDGLRPASTSSSSSSSRLGRERAGELQPLAARDREAAAGWSSSAPRPTALATASAAAERVGARRRGADARRPRCSRARVRPAKGCTIWKVRAMPSAARCGAAAGRSMSRAVEDDRGRRSGCRKPAIDREQRGLAGAVRPDQAGDAARRRRRATRRRRRAGRRSAWRRPRRGAGAQPWRRSAARRRRRAGRRAAPAMPRGAKRDDQR